VPAELFLFDSSSQTVYNLGIIPCIRSVSLHRKDTHRPVTNKNMRLEHAEINKTADGAMQQELPGSAGSHRELKTVKSVSIHLPGPRRL